MVVGTDVARLQMQHSCELRRRTPMRLSSALFVLAVFALSSSVFAQPRSDVKQIRAQIEALQKQLEALESQSISKRNATQIDCGSRSRLRNPELIVKIYDLGDLFALAPPSAAMRQGDLSKSSDSLFPPSPGIPAALAGSVEGAATSALARLTFGIRAARSTPQPNVRQFGRRFDVSGGTHQDN